MDVKKVNVLDRVATNDDVYEHVVLENGDVQHVRKGSASVVGTIFSRAYSEELQDKMLVRTGYNGDYPRRLLPCPYQHRVEITTSGNWTVPTGVTVADVIMIGGGQAGGRGLSSSSGNGGYGGEVLKLHGVTVTPGAVHAAVIGAGGVGTTEAGMAVGGNTTFLGYTAYGGNTPNAKGEKGSRGGVYNAENLVDREGHDNGAHTASAGLPWRHVPDPYIDLLLYGYDPYTGILYAGGGGAGNYNAGYSGGAGAGDGAVNGPGGDATANTGGGGGGGEYSDTIERGGNGGSGIVIIYY